ncbi:MAG: GDSL-type esterase/lipase family protein [Fuerstiella sp.]
MNWLVYHIVSGHSFFTGVALLIIAALASTRSHRILKRVTVLAFLIGPIAIILSSTAIPYWFYAVAAVITCGWIVSRFKKNWRPNAAYLAAAVWFAAAVIELPYHIIPSLDSTHSHSIAVIGDSVTAGVGGDETSETWPSILAREHQLDVQDISHMGETAASALKRAKANQITASVVVVEIGGNDVLGSTSAAQFAQDLDALLSHLAVDERQLLMFELPLPPFCHEYGRVQRQLAAKYNVRLIPKRVFLSVIAGGDSTLDTIHLSQSGHRTMANCVWRLVSSAFAPDSAP